MTIDLNLRKERVAEIMALCAIDPVLDRVLLQQLDSFSNLGIEVAHTLLLRAQCDYTSTQPSAMKVTSE